MTDLGIDQLHDVRMPDDVMAQAQADSETMGSQLTVPPGGATYTTDPSNPKMTVTAKQVAPASQDGRPNPTAGRLYLHVWAPVANETDKGYVGFNLSWQPVKDAKDRWDMWTRLYANAVKVAGNGSSVADVAKYLMAYPVRLRILPPQSVGKDPMVVSISGMEGNSN